MRRAARKRRTRQLEQVFEAVQGDHTHPFAHEIYRRVHKRLPRISLATVYRNLHSLVEEGKSARSSWMDRERGTTPRPASTIISSARDAVEWMTCSCGAPDDG